MTMYALIIDGCYCGQNSIEKVYPTLYEAILGARDWLDDHFVNGTDRYLDMLSEFADNDFLFIECVFNIVEFEID